MHISTEYIGRENPVRVPKHHQKQQPTVPEMEYGTAGREDRRAFKIKLNDE